MYTNHHELPHGLKTVKTSVQIRFVDTAICLLNRNKGAFAWQTWWRLCTVHPKHAEWLVVQQEQEDLHEICITYSKWAQASDTKSKNYTTNIQVGSVQVKRKETTGLVNVFYKVTTSAPIHDYYTYNSQMTVHNLKIFVSWTLVFFPGIVWIRLLSKSKGHELGSVCASVF